MPQREDQDTATASVQVGTIPALLSDRRCPACGLRLGADPYWCLTCNEYAENVMLSERHDLS